MILLRVNELSGSVARLARALVQPVAIPPMTIAAVGRVDADGARHVLCDDEGGMHVFMMTRDAAGRVRARVRVPL